MIKTAFISKFHGCRPQGLSVPGLTESFCRKIAAVGAWGPTPLVGKSQGRIQQLHM